MNRTILKRAVVNACVTVCYVALVTGLMQNAPKFFGKMEDSIFGPVAFLLLFVVSAAITGSLVLGKPILLYLECQKKEAVQLFVYTLGTLIVAIVLILAVLLLVA